MIAALDTDGYREIRNNSSRLGLRGSKRLTDGIEAFGRARGRGQSGQPIARSCRAEIPARRSDRAARPCFSRLGYVGLDTGIGSFAWGKQWSAYYDVAVFTDQFPLWSGVATGAFAAGTDGGVSGTGRSEQALQYREARGPVSVALQMQSRASSPNDRSWVDVWGASGVVGKPRGSAWGRPTTRCATASRARTPTSRSSATRPPSSACATGPTASTRRRPSPSASSTRWTTSAAASTPRASSSRCATTRPTSSWLEAGYNDLRPDSDHPGEFRTRFGVGYVVYNFGAGSRLFGGFKLEDSRNSDGSKRLNSAFATGLNYTF